MENLQKTLKLSLFSSDKKQSEFLAVIEKEVKQKPLKIDTSTESITKII